MKLINSFLASAAAAGLVMTPAPVLSGNNMAPSVPIEAWALRDVITDVEVSPDGKHMLILKLESKEGEYVLEIYNTSDMTKPIRRLNSSPMEFISASWVSDKHIFGAAWQVVRKTVDRQEGDVRSYKAYAYNLETNKFSEAQGSFSLENLLPNEPDTILISEGNANRGGTGVDPFEAFRPRAYYRYNLNTGARNLVLKGTTKHPSATFDSKGNPRYTTGYDSATKQQIFYYRMPGDSSWKEFGERFDLNDHENLYRVLGGFQGLVGFDPDDPSIGYVIDNRGEDKAALWEFNFATGQFGEKVYGNPDADIIGVQRHSMYWAGEDRIVAAIYSGEKHERAWFDAEEKALYDGLMAAIPNAHSTRVTSRSRDGGAMTVYNQGPHDPGSYWIMKGGKLSKLGSKNPLLKPEDLSDVEFIKYPARDGRIIPAYVTKPKGTGPFPLIVLPHGGPHVNEVIDYDEWGQFLANAGYMVLQPQYRMSVGWGKSHFDAAYGQHGLAMQDDKDDGALYLVQKGLVDKDRMAMFGWSYGGYAALVATTRDNNIYQCAIAGAAVADPEKSYNQSRGPGTPEALDDWGKRRGTIGINPIKEVSKANIPLLMIHGDVDSRVLYYHYKDYKVAMEKAGKPAQYLTLKGADHFYRTLMYNHQTDLYTSMINFLANDCGPDGL